MILWNAASIWEMLKDKLETGHGKLRQTTSGWTAKPYLVREKCAIHIVTYSLLLCLLHTQINRLLLCTTNNQHSPPHLCACILFYTKNTSNILGVNHKTCELVDWLFMSKSWFRATKEVRTKCMGHTCVCLCALVACYQLRTPEMDSDWLGGWVVGCQQPESK